MAEYITTNTTLKAEYIVLQAELDRLTDCPDFAGDDALGAHKAAWAMILRDLKKRRPPIEESDLDDTTELEHAAHLGVLYILYRMSDLESDQVEANRWYKQYRKELRELEFTVGGSEISGSGEDTVVVRG